MGEGTAMPEPVVTKNSLANLLFSIGALRFGKFTLSSGKQSSYYLDLRVVPSYPEAYSMEVDAYRQLAAAVGEDKFDMIAGVATAGVTISSPLAFLLKKPMAYVRGEEKGHGLGRQVEGALRPGWRALVVDDLVTTGGSVIGAVKALRKGGCRVTDAAVLVDRLEGAAKNLADVGVKLHSFTNVKELVDVLFASKKVTKRDHETVLRQIGRGPD